MQRDAKHARQETFSSAWQLPVQTALNPHDSTLTLYIIYYSIYQVNMLLVFSSIFFFLRETIETEPKWFLRLLKAIHSINNILRRNTMSNRTLVPEAKDAMNKFKMEAASEVGVSLKNGYNGDLTAKQAGSIGGQMVKKMIQSAENSLKSGSL